jgi:hypothetical protein
VFRNIICATFAQEKRLMNRRLLNVTLVAATFALATASVAAPNTTDKSPLISRGHKYCWHDSGWNGAG